MCGADERDQDVDMKILKLINVGTKTTVEGKSSDDEEDAEMYLQAWDDVSGEERSPAEVKEARDKEMQYIEEKGVWRVVSRQEAEKREVKIVQTRWIDIDKGDKTHPNYRSRLVAKELQDGDQEGLFASTPPLEALKLLISMTATVNRGVTTKERVIMTNDVARAFFEAPMRRTVCGELPREAHVGEHE